MDRRTLEQYRAILTEIADLNGRLDALRQVERVTDTVKGSDPKWPHHKRVFKVEGPPLKRSPAACTLEGEYQQQIRRLNETRVAIEQWIAEIPDSWDRQIFRLYCIDGLTFSDIAARMHMSESTVRYRRFARVLRERGVR